MKERVYTEQEIAALIERTAELQAEQERRGGKRSGLTLPELQAVAAEAGLDPSLLRQAAAEMDEPRSLLPGRTSKSATHIFTERWVAGPFNPDAWEDIVAELRHQFDTSLAGMMGMPQYGEGTVEQIGRSMSWKHTSMSGIETRVLVRPRGDKVHVRLSQRVGWGSTIAEGVFYGAILAFLVAVVASALADSNMLGVIAFLVTLIVSAPLVRFADEAWRRKKLRELEVLGDRVSSLMTATLEAEAPATMPQQTPVQKLDPALLDRDEEPAQEYTPARTRTRDT